MKWDRGKKEDRPKAMDQSVRKHDRDHDDERRRRDDDETRTNEAMGTDDARPTPDRT